MVANNLMGTNDSVDGDSKENLTGAKLVQHDSTIHVNDALDATTGGQVKGGVVASSGNRVQKENPKGSESSQDL